MIAQLSEQLGHSWRDVRAGTEITGRSSQALTTVLGPAESHRAGSPGSGSGRARRRCHAVQSRREGAPRGSRAAVVDRRLGFSSVEPQQPPTILGGVRGDRPLEPSVSWTGARHTASRAGPRRAARHPAAVRGGGRPVVRAMGVARRGQPGRAGRRDRGRRRPAPLTDAAATRYQLPARFRRGCAKRPTFCTRAAISSTAVRSIPRQQQVIDDLAAFAHPYLSRLWARLHGRDVWQEPCTDVDDVRHCSRAWRGRSASIIASGSSRCCMQVTA